jgi:hypothetical protein
MYVVVPMAEPVRLKDSIVRVSVPVREVIHSSIFINACTQMVMQLNPVCGRLCIHRPVRFNVKATAEHLYHHQHQQIVAVAEEHMMYYSKPPEP